MAAETISFAPSGNVTGILYDADGQHLIVRFRSGHTYRYLGVTGEEAYGFGQALSSTEYLNRQIIPQHIGQRISGEEAESLFYSGTP